jgi:hypothetical protein
VRRCSGAGPPEATELALEAAQQGEAQVMRARDGQEQIRLVSLQIRPRDVLGNVMGTSNAVWHLLAEARLPFHAGARCATGMHLPALAGL